MEFFLLRVVITHVSKNLQNNDHLRQLNMYIFRLKLIYYILERRKKKRYFGRMQNEYNDLSYLIITSVDF